MCLQVPAKSKSAAKAASAQPTSVLKVAKREKVPLDAGTPAQAGSPSAVGGGAAVSSGEKEAASAASRASLRSKASAEELADCSLTSCSGGHTVKEDPEAPANTRRRKRPAVGSRAARQHPADLTGGKVTRRKKKVAAVKTLTC